MNTDELWAKLEAAGEALVRENLAAGRYSSGKIPLIREWLRKKEEARTEARVQRAEQAVERQLDIAQSAQKAAWVSARTAIASVVIAAVAAVAAIVAVWRVL